MLEMETVARSSAVSRFPSINLARPGVMGRRCCWLPEGQQVTPKLQQTEPDVPSGAPKELAPAYLYACKLVREQGDAWWLSRWLSRVPGDPYVHASRTRSPNDVKTQTQGQAIPRGARLVIVVSTGL